MSLQFPLLNIKKYPNSTWPRNIGYFPKERIEKQGKMPIVNTENKYMCNLPYVLKFKRYNIMYIDDDKLMISLYK
jgi:hypothetical protein